MSGAVAEIEAGQRDQSALDELRTGWPLLLACMAGVGASAICLPFQSIGPLTKPVEAAMGWTRSEIQFAILFSSGIGALTAPLAGWMVERFGPRVVAVPSVAGVSIGLFVASFATTLPMFYFGYALAAILGAGTNPVLWSRVIAGHFVKGRGFALGLGLVGTGLVALLVPNLMASIVPENGWRFGLRIIAALPIIITLPLVLLYLRSGDTAVVQRQLREHDGMSVRAALCSYRFWVLSLSVLCAYLGFSGAGPNLVPAFSDNGMTVAGASAVAGIYGISQIPGRLLSGFLIDRFWAPMVACILLLIPAVACLILKDASDPRLLILGCFMMGLGAGSELDVLSFLVARYFGLLHYPRIYAFSYVGLAVGAATAPTLFSRLHEFTGSYNLSFGVSAGLFAVGAGLVLLLGRYPASSADERSERSHG